MNKKILSDEKINEVLSRARYWNEVNNRDSGGSTNIGAVLQNELHDVVRSLGLSILWVLEEYANECKNSTKVEQK